VRAVGLTVLALVFWTAVVLAQRPWQGLARRLASDGTPQPLPPTGADNDLAHEFHADDSFPFASPELESYLDALTFGTQRACQGMITPQERELARREPMKKPRSRK